MGRWCHFNYTLNDGEDWDSFEYKFWFGTQGSLDVAMFSSKLDADTCDIECYVEDCECKCGEQEGGWMKNSCQECEDCIEMHLRDDEYGEVKALCEGCYEGEINNTYFEKQFEPLHNHPTILKIFEDYCYYRAEATAKNQEQNEYLNSYFYDFLKGDADEISFDKYKDEIEELKKDLSNDETDVRQCIENGHVEVTDRFSRAHGFDYSPIENLDEILEDRPAWFEAWLCLYFHIYERIFLERCEQMTYTAEF